MIPAVDEAVQRLAAVSDRLDAVRAEHGWVSSTVTVQIARDDSGGRAFWYLHAVRVYPKGPPVPGPDPDHFCIGAAEPFAAIAELDERMAERNAALEAEADAATDRALTEDETRSSS